MYLAGTPRQKLLGGKEMVSINWMTPETSGIGNALGYAHHNRKMFEHTSKLMDVSDPFSDIVLHITPADQFEPIPNKINVLFTMWEMLDVPESYNKGLAEADYVITPCRFVKNLFKPLVKRPIYVVGEGMEPEDYPFFKRKAPDYSKGERFRIYWAGAPNPRKGYHYALELIKHVLDNPHLELYIKTTLPTTSPADVKKAARKYIESGGEINPGLHKKIADPNYIADRYKNYCRTDTKQVKGKHQNIIFDTRRVEFSELRELYNKANLFIFPSMGEGWGLMGTEALATGCPMVAPMVTGIADYFNSKLGYVCKHYITSVKSTNYDITARSYACDPDDFFKKTFHVINNYNEALNKGKKASKAMHENFTWARKGELLKSVLEDIHSKAIL